MQNSNVLQKILFDFNHQIFSAAIGAGPASASENVNKVSFFSKTKFSKHELWRHKVSSISDLAQLIDHFELQHNSDGSRPGNLIHQLKQALEEHWRHSEVNHQR